MIEFLEAGNGKLTARHRGAYLHSRYDPVSEAERYIANRLDSRIPSTVVVIGPCLGYIVHAVSSRFPRAKIISVFLSAECRERAVAMGDFSWAPGDGTPIREFIAAVVSERDVRDMEIIEWDPSARAFPELAAAAREAVRDIVRQHAGSLVTSALFGRRWIRNSVINFLGISSIMPLPVPRSTICIAASGPSLARSLPEIAAMRSRITLWALPSSIKALVHHGLEPDLVIQTDAGQYARYHLAEIPRGARYPVAAPLTSVLLPLDRISPLCVLDQRSFFEQALLHDLPAVSVPWNGTVAGTAFSLASAYGRPFVFAGLDLADDDIRSHVSPHSFEPLRHSGTDRFRPVYTVYYRRALDTTIRLEGRYRTSSALRTYGSWFTRASVRFPGMIHRIGDSPVDIEGMTRVPIGGLKGLIDTLSAPRFSGHGGPEQGVSLTPAERTSRVERAIDTWLDLLGTVRGGGPVWETRGHEILYLLAGRDFPALEEAWRMKEREAYRAILERSLRDASEFLSGLRSVCLHD